MTTLLTPEPRTTTISPGERLRLHARLGALRNSALDHHDRLVAEAGVLVAAALLREALEEEVVPASPELEGILASAKRARARSEQAAAALERLDAETYGTCVVCAGPLAAERLRLFPAEPWCRACRGAPSLATEAAWR